MASNPHSSCAGKIGYRNPTQAARAMKALSRRRNATPHAGISPYRCDYCGEWHLGRRPKLNRKAAKRDLQFVQRRSREIHSPA